MLASKSPAAFSVADFIFSRKYSVWALLNSPKCGAISAALFQIIFFVLSCACDRWIKAKAARPKENRFCTYWENI